MNQFGVYVTKKWEMMSIVFLFWMTFGNDSSKVCVKVEWKAEWDGEMTVGRVGGKGYDWWYCVQRASVHSLRWSEPVRVSSRFIVVGWRGHILLWLFGVLDCWSAPSLTSNLSEADFLFNHCDYTMEYFLSQIELRPLPHPVQKLVWNNRGKR